MNPVDRFQALIRHPDYREGARRYVHIKGGLLNFISKVPVGGESYELWCEYLKMYVVLRTWGLDHLVDPDNKEEVAAVLDALHDGGNSIFLDDLRGHDANEREDKIDPGRGCLISLFVDLERPTSELQMLFAKMVNEKRKQQEVKVKRVKPHRVDPWTVWDRMQLSGNNLLKVTRALCQVRGNPAYDGETKRAYDQVMRANQKAVAMIEEVGGSRNKALTEDAVKAYFMRGIRKMIEALQEL